MTAIALNPFVTYTDANGLPLAGGKIYTYAAGTTTPQATYTDATQISSAANPIILDAAGRSPYGAIWGAGTYKLRLTTSADVDIYTVDNVQATGAIPDGTTIATPTAGDNSTKIANTAFTQNAINIYSNGFLNKFRNPGMNISQRGTSGTITAGSSGYTTDGWIVGATGANATWASTFYAGSFSNNSIGITGNTSMSDTYIKQRIESSIVAPFYPQGAPQQVTCQFRIFNNSGATLTPTLTIKAPTAVDNYAGTNTILAATNLQSINAGSSGTVAYTFATTSGMQNGGVVTGLEVTLDFGAALNANTKNIYITDADIRATPGVPSGLNSNPPAPELRPIGVEYSFCHRYYQKSYAAATVPGTAYSAGNAFCQCGGVSGNNLYLAVTFKTTMRAAPTVTLYDAVGTAAKLNGFNGSWNSGINPTATYASENNMTVQCLASSGYIYSSFEYTAISEL